MEHVLVTQSLSKHYKDFKALDGLSMHVPKGSIYGFVGRNGAGKTTLIRLICGLQAPTAGTYFLYGADPGAKSMPSIRRRMGAMVETPSIYLDLTAGDNLREQFRVLGVPSDEGIPLLGWFTQPPALLLTALAGSLLMTAAFCSIFTFVVMNVSRKSISVVICLLGVFAAFIGSIVLHSMLEAPEFISGYELSMDGQIVSTIPEPNPNYLTGTKRELYQFIFDLLPTGQAVQYCSLVIAGPVRLMGLAAAVCAVFTGGGAALFHKKDLK